MESTLYQLKNNICLLTESKAFEKSTKQMNKGFLRHNALYTKPCNTNILSLVRLWETRCKSVHYWESIVCKYDPPVNSGFEYSSKYWQYCNACVVIRIILWHPFSKTSARWLSAHAANLEHKWWFRQGHHYTFWQILQIYDRDQESLHFSGHQCSLLFHQL